MTGLCPLVRVCPASRACGCRNIDQGMELSIREELLTVPLVSALADDLLRDQYRLPFEPGGFAEWCDREGLF